MRYYSVTRADGTTQHIEGAGAAYFRVNNDGDLIVFDALTRAALHNFKCSEWLSVHNGRATYQTAENKSQPIDLSPGMAGSPL